MANRLRRQHLTKMGGPSADDFARFMAEMRLALLNLQTQFNTHVHPYTVAPPSNTGVTAQTSTAVIPPLED